MPTDIERGYEEQGYSLPDGLSWEKVAALHAHCDISPIYVPIATGPGRIGWGVPFIGGKHLKHP